jgi:2-polyprenyl-3-methyl-5-hydroxy-6-metoxy-1,4-benzoquinol methylase
MSDLQKISEKMRQHYQCVWQEGDAWEFETSTFEQARYDHQLALLQGRHFARVLEIGCGSGCFTRRLAGIADHVLALDIAEAALERARVQTQGAGPGTIEFQAANVMELELEERGPWDLIVFSETIYCLGWAYSFFDVAYLAHRLLEATTPGGYLLLANTYGRETEDWLLRPWLIDTYRDLFRNVGYTLRSEQIFRGTKDGDDFQVLVSLFEKPTVVP